ncbi:MAG TPA: oligopeptide/dipeptide ABC transporter ATP-binding protein, partial [Acidimicrobiales bacterium]|nr:oligopeptide/dipeptide ABC transporter ATP-binding protein [Acidimicrobiales bacterium]
DVSFDVAQGETLGIVGESGCGKSTTGKAVMQLPSPTAGRVYFDGVDLTKVRGPELREQRKKMQMIFQDPVSSLYPRRSIAELVAEPLAIWEIGTPAERIERVKQMLTEVGMDFDHVSWRHPYEFSIGQCQRISFARALMLNPKVIVCDEPVSALDVSVQAQILNLLEDMKRRYGLTLIFISHDLAVVKNVSDRVMVMYLGKICEMADAEGLYSAPSHPYTRALLMASVISSRALARGGSAPVASLSAADQESDTEMPSSIAPPSGCRYRTRCPRVQGICAVQEPVMREIKPGHFVACHFPLGAAPSTAATTSSASTAAV